MADTYGGVTTSSVNVTVVDTIAGLAHYSAGTGPWCCRRRHSNWTPIWSNQFGQPDRRAVSNAPAVTWSISPTSGRGHDHAAGTIYRAAFDGRDRDDYGNQRQF